LKFFPDLGKISIGNDSLSENDPTYDVHAYLFLMMQRRPDLSATGQSQNPCEKMRKGKVLIWSGSDIRGFDTSSQTMSDMVMITIQEIKGPSLRKNYTLTIPLSHKVAELHKQVCALTDNRHCWLSLKNTQLSDLSRTLAWYGVKMNSTIRCVHRFDGA
jgi:hypothetical protein